MILVSKTDNPAQLAAIYTAADCFFNPTLEDNYPIVSLEAEACGTFVVGYDTGGCTETLSKLYSTVEPDYAGACVRIGNAMKRRDAIKRVATQTKGASVGFKKVS